MTTSANHFRCLSGSSLKIIAICAMAIDHFAASVLYYGYILPAVPLVPHTTPWILYQVYQAMRFIGRIAFPIFCFLLVEGFLHTSNEKSMPSGYFFFP